MDRLFGFLGFLLVVVLIVGFFRGWFSFSADSGKIHSDLQKVQKKVSE